MTLSIIKYLFLSFWYKTTIYAPSWSMSSGFFFPEDILSSGDIKCRYKTQQEQIIITLLISTLLPEKRKKEINF